MRKIHFNNAGSSISKKEVIFEINRYLKLEKKIGGYEAQEKKKELLNSFYFNVSKLINCSASEISFLTNSTLAWNQVFNSIPLGKHDDIVISENEYSSNYLSILKRRNSFNKLKIIKLNKNGMIDLSDLVSKLDSRTKVLSINHIASQCGTKLPVERIGEILKNKNKNAIYIVDACQSIGQTHVDVKKINCDFLTASGRKFLRGPRGSAFLYVKKSIKKKIEPVFIDMSVAKVGKNEKIIINNDARLMENFEYSPALKLGLSTAIASILKFGVKKINKKIIKLTVYFRSKVSENKNITLYENEDSLSGLNTIDFLNKNINDLCLYLKSFGVNTYVSDKITSSLYFNKIKKKSLLRISFHHFNTKKEIDYLVSLLEDYGS